MPTDRDDTRSPFPTSADTVPAPGDTPLTLEDADPETAAAIRKRMAEIDLSRSGAVIDFGSDAQAELQRISQSMLGDVRSKDLGPAGAALREIVTTLRGFSAQELNPNRKRSIWERVTFRAKPAVRAMARYETVQGQIHRIAGNLEGHEHQLLKDIRSLDRLYDKTLAFYRELSLYIAAGSAKLDELDQVTIPQQEAALETGVEVDRMAATQALRDLRAVRDDLDRRVHDLRLTRQVTMQALPSIRLVQENDKALVTRINSTLVNTVPLWETQLAQALTIQHSADAAGAVADATNLTNELLTANADNLRKANRRIREETERGIVDVAAVRRANTELIDTIEDSLRIADEGRARRREAEGELQEMETELRRTLASAQARETGRAT